MLFTIINNICVVVVMLISLLGCSVILASSDLEEVPKSVGVTLTLVTIIASITSLCLGMF